MIRCMAAIDDKLGLATDKGIPWYLPSDSKRWKTLTQSGTNVLGIGGYLADYATGHVKLNDRPYLVVSSHQTDTPMLPGFKLVPSPDPFLQAAQTKTDDVWIVGGAGLFASTLQYADELYLTRVQGDFKCTKFFPVFENNFELAKSEPPITERGITYHYEIWRRKVSANSQH